MFNPSKLLQMAGTRVLVAALLNVAAGAVSANVINVSSSSGSLAVGQNVSVSFSIDGLTGALYDSLSAFDLDIRFDPAVLHLTGFGFTDPATGQNQLDLAPVGPFPFLGDALVSGNVIDAYGLSGNSAVALDAGQADAFIFLVLNFIATAPSGLSIVEIDLLDPLLLFVDSNQSTLDARIGPSSVSLVIGDPIAPVPEPATLSLFAVGAAALLAMRRRVSGAMVRAAHFGTVAAGAAVLTLGLTGTLPASAQIPSSQSAPQAAAANAASAAETVGVVDAVIVAVEGQRLQLRLPGGATRWVTVVTTASKSQVGKKVSGIAVVRGDTYLLTNPKFAD